MLSCNHAIPCTRYGESGDGDPRVREVLAYAAGEAGPALQNDSIAWLHDYRGELTVAWRSPFDMAVGRTFINSAWAQYGNECWVRHILVVKDDSRMNAEANGERRG